MHPYYKLLAQGPVAMPGVLGKCGLRITAVGGVYARAMSQFCTYKRREGDLTPKQDFLCVDA